MGSKCRFSKKNVGATDVGYKKIPSGDERALKAAVATVGPISIAIDASNLQHYGGGNVQFQRNCTFTYASFVTKYLFIPRCF